MNLVPATRDMLVYTGLLEHPEAREFLDLWGGGVYAILDDGQPFAIIAIKDHPESTNCCWGNAWVTPSHRGRWLTEGTRELVKSFALMRHDMMLAATDNPVCGRLLKAQGFKMYCQTDGVSYYSLAREAH